MDGLGCLDSLLACLQTRNPANISALCTAPQSRVAIASTQLSEIHGTPLRRFFQGFDLEVTACMEYGPYEQAATGSQPLWAESSNRI